LEQSRPRFEAASTRVLAINPASLKSHQGYANKKGFTFPILSDIGEKVVASYHCQKPTGKGVERTVYAIDPEGKIIFAERGHASYEAILEKIRSSSE